ncbi:synaptotagmin-like protein 2 isoform X4 [Mugil cephalus]|uniref:synaptotagmin-like protein 2 isoform X4 n=1 Tax=Mugil cephalus TaxID=48193 RepID=UPI001FB60E50|nr:synaptotagmin-like protein 2 isoform X4 [Mugil cephalus]
MIDLSFLTEEEKDTILAVLNRDAELKKAEEHRVENLQKTVSNKSRLKYLTGEWFYETKQRRHQDRIHGSDLIRASMRHTNKPLTILELSQILPERSSFVCSANKDVFVPPVLCGLIQEPSAQFTGDGYLNQNPYEIQQDTPKPVLQSPTKRKNPFNNELVFEENLLLDGATAQTQMAKAGYGEGSHPVMSALRRLSSRGMSSSKSHENLTSETREQRILSNSKELFSSVNDVSSLSPSASTAMHMKACASVPVLQQDETDSDGIFETNLGSRRNTSSSMSNLSISSGMASMSSISGSMSSIYPADFGAIDVQGSIQFAANYIQKLGEFHMFVVLCRDLAVADTKKNRSDPYVKCYLLPDKTKLGKRKTKVKKKTLNPIYNEMIGYKIDIETLKSQILNVSVWHNDTFGRNVFLGEVNLNFAEWDFSNTQINEYTLKARAPSQNPPLCLMDVRGQMRVALRFLPQTSHSKKTSRTATGEVQIWVKDCKNLPPVRGIIIDPFVKCTVLPDVSRKSRQKTRVVKRTANPMFNHTMVYDGFRAEDLREACVEITVWDHDRLKNHYIGGLRLGLGTGKSYGVEVDWMDSTSDEVYLWQRMLQSDGEWVEDVLPLRVYVMAKNMPQ